MKVIILDSPLKIGIKSIPMAERKNDNEALIKVRALGIWGIDMVPNGALIPSVDW